MRNPFSSHVLQYIAVIVALVKELVHQLGVLSSPEKARELLPASSSGRRAVAISRETGLGFVGQALLGCLHALPMITGKGAALHESEANLRGVASTISSFVVMG